LRARLPGVEMRPTDDLGVPEAAKEALVFAIIGFLSLCDLPATVPTATGARHASVLGSITPGRRRLDVPRAVVGPPTKLLVRPGGLSRP
jgi:anhydro-N-acetylmuramic acid kinase